MRACASMKVGGADLGSMPDRRGHALGLGERASGIGGRFFRLRETSLEFDLALGLCGSVLLARRIQVRLRLLAGRSEITCGRFLGLGTGRGGRAIGLRRRRLAQPLQNRSERRIVPVAIERAFERSEPGTHQVAKRVQFLAGGTLDLGGDGIHRLGLGFQRALRNRLSHSWRGRSRPPLGASVVPREWPEKRSKLPVVR